MIEVPTRTNPTVDIHNCFIGLRADRSSLVAALTVVRKLAAERNPCRLSFTLHGSMLGSRLAQPSG
jgi:hypothetical protein